MIDRPIPIPNASKAAVERYTKGVARGLDPEGITAKVIGVGSIELAL